MGKLTPWMHPSEIAMIEKYLNKDMTMLEWGSGGSTVHFAPQVKKLISIEHQMKWFVQVRKSIPKNVDYYYVPANNDGISIKYSTHADYKDYIEVIEVFNTKFDAVLIDGRARRFCAEYVIPYLNEGAVVFIHDFYKKNRERYHKVLELYDEIDFIKGTVQGLTVLKLKI